MSVFTASSLQPVGRLRTIRGRKVAARYANKHCQVEYVEGRGGQLRVSVMFADGHLAEWTSVAAFPSIETARIAAESAHRQRGAVVA